MKEKSVPQSIPGPIVLFGSGETSPSGQKVFDQVFRRLPPNPRIGLLETPAGFELNSTQVIGRVGDFLKHNLQNFNPTSPGITYFKEHETNKHIHHGGMHSHPANKTTPIHRDTTVPDKIEKWRKRSNIFEVEASHSHKLEVVKV